jgi:hypothetical protein
VGGDREIHGANQQIIALDARIPSLESEKKLAVSGTGAIAFTRHTRHTDDAHGTHVTHTARTRLISVVSAGRNFKEAKRIAEEMKTASVQIEESKDTVAALTEQVRDL